jgi:hypothetical protein
MDIPTGIVGLVGLVVFLSWLFAEYRDTHRLARIGLGVLCILALSFAARGSLSGPLYLHKQLLRAIDRELEKGEPSRVRHALGTYFRTFESTHDFAIAPVLAADELYEGRTPSGWKAKPNPALQKALPISKEASNGL